MECKVSAYCDERQVLPTNISHAPRVPELTCGKEKEKESETDRERERVGG